MDRTNTNLTDRLLYGFDGLFRSQLSAVCRDKDTRAEYYFKEGGVPWLPMRLDAFLDIVGEVIIHGGVRSTRLQIRNDSRAVGGQHKTVDILTTIKPPPERRARSTYHGR